jgi:hypothetical protein
VIAYADVDPVTQPVLGWLGVKQSENSRTV